MPLKEYSDIPPLANIKALLTECGVTFSDPALFNNYPDIGTYKTKRRILQPVAEGLKVYDRSEDNSLIPSEVTVGIGEGKSIVKLGYRENSPLEIRLNKQGDIEVVDRETNSPLPAEVNLVKRLKYQDATIPAEIDPSQPKLSEFVDMVGIDRLSVITFDGCWNWNCGKACQFCDFNPKRETDKVDKPSLNTLHDFGADLDLWWDSQKFGYLRNLKFAFRHLLSTETIEPHKHLLIMSGNLPKPTKVWDIAAETVEALNEVEKVENFDNYLNICPHPDGDRLQAMKMLGVKQVQYNLEVIGAELFKRICPGKMEYSKFQSKLVEAVGTMGFGNVRSNFVLGLQPIDELLAGIEQLARVGVVADFSIFQPKRSTPLEIEKPPTMDEIVAFSKRLALIYKKYDFKPIYCGLSSRSSIINECMK